MNRKRDGPKSDVLARRCVCVGACVCLYRVVCVSRMKIHQLSSTKKKFLKNKGNWLTLQSHRRVFIIVKFSSSPPVSFPNFLPSFPAQYHPKKLHTCTRAFDCANVLVWARAYSAHIVMHAKTRYDAFVIVRLLIPLRSVLLFLALHYSLQDEEGKKLTKGNRRESNLDRFYFFLWSPASASFALLIPAHLFALSFFTPSRTLAAFARVCVWRTGREKRDSNLTFTVAVQIVHSCSFINPERITGSLWGPVPEVNINEVVRLF